MVYDAADHYVLFFSGAGEISLYSSNETWTYVSGYWTNITSSSSPPPPRSGAAMTYDAKDGYVLLFGGSGGLTVGSDTWKYAGGTWTQLKPTKSPPTRELQSMAYDAKDGYVVMYGGLGGSGNAIGDTWTFAAGKWTRLNLIAGTTAPEQRYSSSMAYDEKDGYIFLFGGFVYFKPQGYFILNDTYTFSGGTWTRLSISYAPSPRDDAGLAYDASGGYLVLFGGDTLGGRVSDTWTYSGGAWTELTGTHPSNQSSNLVADPLDGYMLLYVGGANESWKLLNGGWMPVVSAREWAGLVYDAADKYVLLFGGATGSGPVPRVLSAETWKFVGGVWTNLTGTVVGSPSAREWFTMTYDAADGYVVLFGGYDGTNVLGDTWTYLSGTWTQLSPSSSPSPRILSSMTYDAADGYVVLFGGATSLINLCQDTWKFVGGSWTNISAKKAPPVREGASLAYDAADGYVLLFGGQGTSSQNGGYLGDTWTFSAGKWTHLLLTIHPKYRAQATMTYDAADGYIILYGGTSTPYASGFHSDSWKYLGGVWTKVTGSPAPPGEIRQGSTYDAEDGYVVVFGGETTSGALRGDIWEYAAGTYTLLVG